MWIVYIPSSPSIVFEALLFFALAGILAQCVGRTLNYLGVNKLGVSINSPIIGANPLFATIMAIILLKEFVSPLTYIGIILIVLGIVLISRKAKGSNEAKDWRKRFLIFPLGAAICYGASTNLTKIGLTIFPSSISGTTFATSAGLSTYILFLILSGKIKTISLSGRSIWFFLGSGISISAAWICRFSAVNIGKVTVVSTIGGAEPLFALILSRILLKHTEKITDKIAIGALAVVLGVILILVFK